MTSPAGPDGIGLDLLEIARLERALERHPGLAQRVFREGELAYAAARARPAMHLAARFCAKEAVGKALGMDAWELRDVEVVSNMQEVRVRGAHVIAVVTEGNDQIARHADRVIPIPATDWMLSPLLAVIPLQLFAYYIARKRGLNVDQPRHLAKTVTVE